MFIRRTMVIKMSDIDGCPKEYDPRVFCLYCFKHYHDVKELQGHIMKEHPESYDHWLNTVGSWVVEC